MSIAVSLVLYQSDPQLLVATLRSLTLQDDVAHLYVLLNDEDRAERETARAAVDANYGRSFTAHHAGSNIGFAAGHNLLLAAAFRDGHDYVLIVNPDIEICPGALLQLKDVSGRYGDEALVSGVLLLGTRGANGAAEVVIDSRGIVWDRTARHHDQDQGVPLAKATLTFDTRQVSGVTGALILVPRRTYSLLLDKTGEFFDADFFAYREDAELGLRARRVGIRSIVLDQPVAVHYRGTPGASRLNPVVNRLGVQNRFLLAYKYGFLRRPGSPLPTLCRDAVVVIACLTVERSSFSGLVSAYRLRAKMREKNLRIMAASGASFAAAQHP